MVEALLEWLEKLDPNEGYRWAPTLHRIYWDSEGGRRAPRRPKRKRPEVETEADGQHGGMPVQKRRPPGSER
jgi:hypothetical protein